MAIKDRYVETVVMPAHKVREHPQNWRRHPESQQLAMGEILEQVGRTTALQGVRLEDGSVQIFDGHLRRDLLGDEDVRVDIYDLTQQEVLYVLATHDPVSTMAEADLEMLKELQESADMSIPDDIAQQLKDLADSVSEGGFDNDGRSIEGKEFGEDAGENVKFLECPKCGHRWVK